MAKSIKALYEDGVFKPLDKVRLETDKESSWLWLRVINRVSGLIYGQPPPCVQPSKCCYSSCFSDRGVV